VFWVHLQALWRVMPTGSYTALFGPRPQYFCLVIACHRNAPGDGPEQLRISTKALTRGNKKTRRATAGFELHHGLYSYRLPPLLRIFSALATRRFSWSPVRPTYPTAPVSLMSYDCWITPPFPSGVVSTSVCLPAFADATLMCMAAPPLMSRVCVPIITPASV
jgi:hypothetical protein